MNNIAINYITFLIEILTLITLITLPIIIMIIKTKKEQYLKISHLNENLIKLKKIFYSKIYNKKVSKELIKHLEKEFYHFKQKKKKNLVIINFNGDLTASDTYKIKNIISLLISERKNIDEVLVKLTSSGGLVNNYGLAALSIKMLKDKNIHVTVSIDLIAASGGYMIASVANKIIASPFSIIGSIGVIGIVPNFNKFLNNKNIDIEYHTSGEYKSTLSMIGKNTDSGRIKFIQTLENTHKLFKTFIKENRPQIDVEKVSTGEYWYGIDALKFNLIDKIQTSEEYIMEKMTEVNIYEIEICDKKSVKNNIIENIKFILLKKLGLM